jgi:FKBP-type peptidyl-prolyl cis-trans isomerase FkpA
MLLSFKRLLVGLVVALATIGPLRAAEPELKTDEDKTFYALGLMLSRNLTPFSLTEKEVAFVKAGLGDGVLKKPDKSVDIDTFMPKVQALAKTRSEAVAAEEKKASAGYLEQAAKEKGAKKTASGLIYTETKAGSGDMPKATDQVKVHYEGKLTDGTIFDSSRKRGEPATFPLNGVIKCWTEGVQLMKVGGQAKLVCPSDIAYGDRGQPPMIKGGATLVFDVELLEIVKK